MILIKEWNANMGKWIKAPLQKLCLFEEVPLNLLLDYSFIVLLSCSESAERL